MARFKNYEWDLRETTDHKAQSWEMVQIAVLMDIRDELRTIRQSIVEMNGIVTCGNAVRIPRILDAINRNTRKPAAKKPEKEPK